MNFLYSKLPDGYGKTAELDYVFSRRLAWEELKKGEEKERSQFPETGFVWGTMRKHSQFPSRTCTHKLL